MMTLAQNKRKLFYALQIGDVPVYETDADGNIIYYESSDGNMIPILTGETSVGYGSPVEFFGNLSMSGGEIRDEEYGLSVSDYDAILIMQKNEIPITETSRIWADSKIEKKYEMSENDILKDSKGENILDLRKNQIVTVNKLGLGTVTDGDTADFRIVAIKPSLNTVKYVLKRIEK